MEALDRIKEYKMDSYTKEHMEYTLDTYKDYVKTLLGLTQKNRDIFLKVLKDNEIRNNQEMEHEDMFMVELQLNSQIITGRPQTSIDVMTDMVLNDLSLTTRRLEQIHRLIIRGTSDDISDNYPIRPRETSVNEVINGKTIVQYAPPAPEEIKPYLRKLYVFLNENNINGELDVFYKPILEHFYIAALQPFGNGNTRLARLTEYIGIFKLTRDTLGLNINKPCLFMSKNHLLTRKYYRDSIAKVVCEPTDENMNKWIEYNLNMIDEQLNFCNNTLAKRFK